jgi:hypothetical protein
MDVFISYNWGVKKQVKALFDILTSSNYQVWLDEKDLNSGNSALTAELAKGIKQSKVFLSCITNDYCKSNNCNLEVEYASAKKKPMIALMIDRIDPTDIDEIQITGRLDETSGIGFIITPFVRINCYKNAQDWPNLNKDEIIKAIKNSLEVFIL